LGGQNGGKKNKKKTIGNKHGGKKRQIKKERKKTYPKKICWRTFIQGVGLFIPGFGDLYLAVVY